MVFPEGAARQVGLVGPVARQLPCLPGRVVSNRLAAFRLQELLEERGDLDGLQALADAGQPLAAARLAELLAERGDVDGLQALADAGDVFAPLQLAKLLAERGDMDGLRAQADAGTEGTAWPLYGLLVKQGRPEEAERLRRFGLNPDGSIAST
jgi:hypothetical protein